MKTKILTALLACVFCQLFAAVASAQSDEPGTVAKLWIIKPKADAADKFEQALARYVEWRRKNNDPWHWDVYVQVDGADAGTYYARSGGHQWADFDRYEEFDRKSEVQWNATVAQYVASAQSSLSEEMPTLSNFPSDATGYRLFTVISYDLKPGHAEDFNQAMKTIVDILRGAQWPHHWAVINAITGPSLPAAVLVIPHKNWADMAEPDPNVFEAVAAKVGQAGAEQMFDAVSSSVRTSQSGVLASLPQFTVEGAK